MIRVVKRSGRVETLDVSKIQKYTSEAVEGLVRVSQSELEVDAKLHGIMNDIHTACVKYGKDGDGYVDYVKGANIAGFVKVADAMLAQGVV